MMQGVAGLRLGNDLVQRIFPDLGAGVRLDRFRRLAGCRDNAWRGFGRGRGPVYTVPRAVASTGGMNPPNDVLINGKARNELAFLFGAEV